EWHVAEVLARICEDLALGRALRRRIRILARARPFVRVSSLPDLAVQVARLAVDAVDVLEHVVVRLDFVPRHAPVLRRTVFGKEALAVTLRHLRADLEIVWKEAPRVAAPVRGGAADHLARLERAQLAHRQRDFPRVVAEGNRLARQVLKDVAVAVGAELRVDVAGGANGAAG